MSDSVLDHLLKDHDNIVSRLLEYVRIPSVSTDPAYEKGMEGARSLLIERMTRAGLSKVAQIEAGGHSAVYGEWLGAPGAPVYLVYGHYDVQPPDPLDKWYSPPFEPQIRDGRIYARGVSDDKGPSSIALEVLFAFLEVEGRLPVNIKVLMEGEEEIGSASLPAILEKYSQTLTSQAVISADGARWRADLPSVNIGSRGNLAFDLSLRSASKDLHSGRFGGAVPNAAHLMARVLADLHAPDGTVVVDGFYDDVLAPDTDTRADIAKLPFDEAGFFDAIETSPFGEPGFSTLERLWLRPTMEINGMWSGYTGEGGKTVIPAEAFAKLTTRLVSGQEPARVAAVLKSHFEKVCPPEAKIELQMRDVGNAAYMVPVDHPLLLAIEQAVEDALGSKPVRVRVGSTLPLSDMIKRSLGIDTVTLSFSTADEDFHSPNEFFRLSAIQQGLTAWVRLLRILGTV